MSKGKVLVVGSNATKIDVQGGYGPTGNYLNETVVPIWEIQDGGYEIVYATPNGTKSQIDEASDKAVHFGGDSAVWKRAQQFFADDPSMNQVRALRSVIEEGLDNYVGMFVPGGQAPVVDLMQDSNLGDILRYYHAKETPTAFLCHGPIATIAAMPPAKQFRAALVAGDTAKAAKLAEGWQYAGYKMTIFSNSEEQWVENDILHAKMYFHVADALKVAGGDVSVGKVDFEPHVTEDRELLCGQNPRSDHQIGKALVAALDRKSAAVGA